MKHRTINAGRFALSGVALATACLMAQPAWALGLGRLNVQSVLGETLRAEIDITSLTPEEATSLRVRVAPAEAYRAAGVEYNAVLPNAQVSVERRADGRSFLRVSSDRAVLEPFVDVILEASWASGRLVREYTMLFDPPGTRLAAAPAPVTAPVASAAPTPAPAAALPAPRVVAPAPSTAPTFARIPQPPSRATAMAAPAAATALSGDEYRVRRGDSLSAVASRTQRPGVSLDQMLVALFRGNPNAFMADNMNRLKAGVVLSVPSADTAKQVSATDARGVIQAQSSDFAAYRQRLAAGVTTAADRATSSRRATGTVQARVDDRKQAATPSPDTLKLSQAAGKASAPATVGSKDGERKDAAARLAELSRNVDDLKKLQQGTAATAAPGPAVAPVGAAPAPAPTPAPLPAPVAPVPPAPVVVAAAPAPAPAPVVPPPVAVPTPAPAPIAAKAPTAAPPVAAAADDSGFFGSLMESPLLLPGAGVLVALLAGVGIYRLRGGGRKRPGETSFLESRLQPDSFFGASGGQRIDTREASTGTASSSSMSYSLSQLDAIGDVDPVAEADVYLAYGRDLQAEEILKEAMRASPDRLAIRIKLLEVYAKRRDTKGFELLAAQLHSTTQGEGEDWAKVQTMGHQIDPENPLYAPGGKPHPVLDAQGRQVEILNANTVPHVEKPGPAAFVPSVGSASLDDNSVDLDLNLDSPSDVTLPLRTPEPPPSVVEMTVPLQTAAKMAAAAPLVQPLAQTPPKAATAPTPAPTPAAASSVDMIDFDLGELAPPPAAPVTAHKAATVSEFGDFTMPTAVNLDQLERGDPLARKMELAEEFRQIGDIEGARDLLEEVIARAEGALKTKAQVMLDGLA